MHTGPIPCSLPLFASSSRSWSWSLGRFSFPFCEGDHTDEGKKKLWVHGLVWGDLGDGGPSLPRLPSKQIVSWDALKYSEAFLKQRYNSVYSGTDLTSGFCQIPVCRSCSNYIRICLLRNAISWSFGKFSFPFYKGDHTEEGKKKLWVQGFVWGDLGDGRPSLPHV